MSLGTYTAMVVFVLLTLCSSNSEKLLNHLLPHDTNTWKIWKRVVLEEVEGQQLLSFDKGNYDSMATGERTLLGKLYEDVEAASKGFVDFVPQKSDNIDNVA